MPVLRFQLGHHLSGRVRQPVYQCSPMCAGPDGQGKFSTVLAVAMPVVSLGLVPQAVDLLLQDSLARAGLCL